MFRKDNTPKTKLRHSKFGSHKTSGVMNTKNSVVFTKNS